MKTAIGKMYQRRLMAAMADGRMMNAVAIASDARLELMDLLDHSGPRGLYQNTLRDLRELRGFVRDFGL